MTAIEILEKAIKIINGKRPENGEREERNFDLIAKEWSNHMNMAFAPEDVCMMMSDLKRVRIKTGYSVDDSLVDMVAYMALAGEYMTFTKAGVKRTDEHKTD